MILNQVSENLRERCRLNPSGPIIVGVSGGPDSQCLFDIINRLQFPLVIAHMNHHLRPEADSEAQQVKNLAKAYDLPFSLGEADVADFAQREKLSIEEAARILRYRFLFDQAERHQAQAVAVGHTADDQVETILMHVLRGSGLSGLRGMLFRALPNTWSQSVPLIRPLLDCWRRDILDYCTERNLYPLQDESNLDPGYLRNRIRLELLPTLESYNPAIRHALWRTGNTLQADYDVLEGILAQAWRLCVHKRGPGYIGFYLSSLQDQPVAVIRSLVRKATRELCPRGGEIDFNAVERTVKYVLSVKQTGKIDVMSGTFACKEDAFLWLSNHEAEIPIDDWPQLPDGVEYSMKIPGECQLLAGWRIIAEPIYDIQYACHECVKNDDPNIAWLRLDNGVDTLIVRGRSTGERLQPFGLEQGSLKLSDYMINQKIPARLRARWPLVCVHRTGLEDGEIAWVAGVQIVYAYRVTANAKHVARLRLLGPG